MTNLSIIIPAFNEEASIARVVHDVRALFSAESVYEIIVLNDGSIDVTAKLAAEAGATVISNPQNMGYGFSLKRAILAATHECLVMVDADGTYPLERIPEMVSKFNEGFDMVVGARQGKAYYSSVTKRIARFCFKWMSEFVVGKKIPDINSGFRVIRRSKILPILPDLSNAFSFSTSSTLIFFLKQYFITYLPVSYKDRTGTSKVRYVRDALRTLQIMVDIIAGYNPIKLFLLLAFLPILTIFLGLGAQIFSRSGIWNFIIVISFFSALQLIALGCFATIFRKK